MILKINKLSNHKINQMIKKKIILGTAQFNKSYGNFFTKKKFTFEHSMKIKKLLIYANKKKLIPSKLQYFIKIKLIFLKKYKVAQIF